MEASFSVTCGAPNDVGDTQMLLHLGQYCSDNGIAVNTITMNDRMTITFTAHKQSGAYQVLQAYVNMIHAIESDKRR